MANIKPAVDKIRGAVYGEDVRESIAGAIELMNSESSTSYALATSYETRVSDLEKTSGEFSTKIKGLQSSIGNLNTSVSESSDKIKTIENIVNQVNAQIDSKIDDVEVIDGYLYLLSNGERVAGPYGPFSGPGGGGGDGGNNAKLTVTNTTGWNYGTFAESQDIEVSLNWTSVEEENPTGPGTLRLTINGGSSVVQTVNQGSVAVNLKPYLQPGSNTVKVQILDVYGNTRTLNFTINIVMVYISSNFDNSLIFDDHINFTYTPVGAVTKTMHYILDGEELSTEVITASGRQQNYDIPKQPHGVHSFEIYFTATVEGMAIESNHLFYEFMCTESGKTDPLISIQFNSKNVDQYDSIQIPYRVYDPVSPTADITISKGEETLYSLTVDRTQRSFTYRALETGDVTITIRCKTVSRSINFTVKESPIKIEAEDLDLSLYLNAYGRSNDEEDPAHWEYDDISCEFENFGWVTDGWVTDDDGITVCRISGNDRLYIPFKIFDMDFRRTGKTIEIEFATRNVRDYEAEILSCWTGDRGIKMTGQLAKMKSEQSEIQMQYKEEEHIRLAFVVQKRAEDRLLICYINGVMSGVAQYPTDDDFTQIDPVGITIGSNECTTDIYCIRVYDNDLTAEQIVDNWIADTQQGIVMMDRYRHNDILDEYGQIVISKLPKDLPYLIIDGEELPQFKGDKKIIAGSYTDPENSGNDFTFSGAQINVQGTSSQYYARKNYKIKFKKGVQKNGETFEAIPLRPGEIAAAEFTFKADVASSEGANNVELVRLYDETCPAETPAMEADERVRWGIDGFPIVIFWRHGDVIEFIGKYNFNNDKGNEDVFGFAAGDESWEIKNNTSDRVIWKNDDFTGTDWLNDFEGRYPDGNEDASNLSQFAAWIKSTDGNLEKFKSEFDTWCDKNSACYYWLFTELFLMIDSRAKNAFPTFNAAAGKWFWLPYDFDTALGINNEGALVFGYSLEDTDTLPGGAAVFNGQKSVFWNNVRDAFYDDIKAMYQNLRSTGAISPEKVEKMFLDHQNKWPEKLVNEDSKFKYLDPLTEDGNASYLSMLQGLKTSQRKWWLYNRFAYMDSKFNAGDSLSDVITIRGYAKNNVTVTPYIDIYPTVKFGSYLTQTRGERGKPTTLECPLSNVNDTEIYIYSASKMASVGDLSGFKVGYADFSSATKLQELILGGDEPYENANLTDIHLGNNELMKYINLQGSVSLTGSLDCSGCVGLEEIDARRTQLRGITFPRTGMLKRIHLPETIANLTIRDQPNLEKLEFHPENISTLWLEGNESIHNLFDPDDTDAVIGKFILPNGNLSGDTSEHCGGGISVSGYIPADTANRYCVVRDKQWSGPYTFDRPDVIYYDETKSFLSISQSYSGGSYSKKIYTPSDFPEGTKYLRFNVNTSEELGGVYPVTYSFADLVDIIPENTRVRMDGIIEVFSLSDKQLKAFFDKFDKLIGLDEYGNNTERPYLVGEIWMTSQILPNYSFLKTNFLDRYPYLTIHGWSDVGYYPNCYSRSGTLHRSGARITGHIDQLTGKCIPLTLTWDQIYSTCMSDPSYRNDTAEFTYTLSGAGLNPDAPELTADSEKRSITLTEGDLDPIYTWWEPHLRTYTVNFYNGTKLLETQTKHYGEVATYHGAMPVDPDGSKSFDGWDKSTYVDGNLNLYAVFRDGPFSKSITDSWSEINYHCDKGDYSERYSIGDTKIVRGTIDGDIEAEITGFDVDTGLDGNTIPITWNSKYLALNDRRSSRVDPSGQWAYDNSEIRRYLTKGLSNNFGDVTRYLTDTQVRFVDDVNTGTTKIIEDKVWVPGFVAYSYENIKRSKRYKPGGTDSSPWWGRNFETRQKGWEYIGSDGNLKLVFNDSNYYGVLPVFATSGITPREITDSWEDIIAYAEAGTAQDHYAYGDWKDLGNGLGKAVIVGFNVDRTVSSVGGAVTGTAGITFMRARLYVNRNNNDLVTEDFPGTNGYSDTNYYHNVEASLLNQLPSEVAGHIKMVKKASNYEADGTVKESCDDSKLWAPSLKELTETYGDWLKLYFNQEFFTINEDRFDVANIIVRDRVFDIEYSYMMEQFPEPKHYTGNLAITPQYVDGSGRPTTSGDLRYGLGGTVCEFGDGALGHPEALLLRRIADPISEIFYYWTGFCI